jgi:predicted GNAT superfamily acetyltransferase
VLEQKTKLSITLRDLESVEDIQRIEAVEKEVWGLADRDVSPTTLLVASKAAGAILIGAFDHDEMIGFAFGFPALEDGHVSIHSHMLAVLPKYRDLDLGYKLKLAQRERALSLGLRQMTWTFDPLQSRNAHFNFAKVGVVSDTYKVDFYGRQSSSALHQNGTDRLWVVWPLASERVRKRIQSSTPPLEPLPSIPPLVRFEVDGRPVRAEFSEAAARQRISIEIPSDIVAMESRDPGLAWEWREATRWAFTESLKAGFVVTDFYRSIRGQQGPGAYLLESGKLSNFVPDM